MGRFCRGKATVLVDITKVNKNLYPRHTILIILPDSFSIIISLVSEPILNHLDQVYLPAIWENLCLPAAFFP